MQLITACSIWWLKIWWSTISPEILGPKIGLILFIKIMKNVFFIDLRSYFYITVIVFWCNLLLRAQPGDWKFGEVPSLRPPPPFPPGGKLSPEAKIYPQLRFSPFHSASSCFRACREWRYTTWSVTSDLFWLQLAPKGSCQNSWLIVVDLTCWIAMDIYVKNEGKHC